MKAKSFIGAVFLILSLSGCGHDFKPEIEEALSKEDSIDFGSPLVAHEYSRIVSQLGLTPPKRIALSRVQQELAEELALLKIKEQRTTNLLAKELLNTPYNREKVKAMMRMIIDHAKKASQLKLTAMLKAKNIIRHGLTVPEIKKVQLSQDAVNLLLSNRGRF